MRQFGPMLLLVAVAGAAAVVVYAQLTDTQTASGTITVSSTAADLYICEPNATPGPDCGSDDSDADEAVFETIEDLRPGQAIEWDIRIKNLGSADFLVTGVTLAITETADPGGDCPDGALQDARHPTSPFESPYSFWGGQGAGVFVLGKNGDDLNDNASNVAGVPQFVRWFNPQGYPQFVNIRVASGDYEDLRLRLELPIVVPAPTPAPTPSPTPAGTGGCDGNEWSVSWVFEVT